MGSLRSASRKELEQFSKPRLACKHLIESQSFELALSGVIVFNLIMMVVEIDTTQNDQTPPSWMKVINVSLLLSFTIESVVRVYVYRHRFFHDHMCLLDALVVGIDIAGKVAEFLFAGKGGLSILRIIRLLRLSRATLIVEQVPELSMLVRSLIGALQPIFWGSIVLVFMLAAWGVLAVQFIHPLNMVLAEKGLYDDCERCSRAYKSVWQSSLTMVQQVIAGDSWGSVTLPLIEEYPATAIFFVMELVCLQVALMNVVLACVVDSAAQARLDDLSGANVKRQLADLCHSLDEDESGEVSYQELKDGFTHNKEFKTRMSKMSIQESDLDVVWDILDTDKGGTVTTMEFVDQLVTIKRANPQTMLIMIRHYITQIRDHMNTQMKVLTQDVKDVEESQRKEEALLETMHEEAMEAEAEARQCQSAPLGASNGQQSNPVNNSLGQRPIVSARAVKIAGVEQPQIQVAEAKYMQGTNAGDADFMNEQRKFMADIKTFMQTTQDIQQKMWIVMGTKLQEVFADSDLIEKSNTNQQGYEGTSTMQFPLAKPGLPLALCPAPSCCTVQKVAASTMRQTSPAVTPGQGTLGRRDSPYQEAGGTPSRNPATEGFAIEFRP